MYFSDNLKIRPSPGKRVNNKNSKNPWPKNELQNAFFFFLGPHIFSVALQLISFPITYLNTERGVFFFF